MRKLIILIFLFPGFSFCQNFTDRETDSSIIEVSFFIDLNSIRVFNELKDKSRIYYKDYYYNTKTIKKEGVFENGYFIGISKDYAPNGQLIRVIDHDKGKWEIITPEHFPYFEDLEKIQIDGNNLIKQVYGKKFYNNHVKWSYGRSNVYSEKGSNDWTDSIEDKPIRYKLCYDIVFDEDHTYGGLIEFDLDSSGFYIPNSSRYTNIYGFEKLPENSDSIFNITYVEALNYARNDGLIESDSNKVEGRLIWKRELIPDLFCGHFTFELYNFLNGKIDTLKANSNYLITKYYMVWFFNPWTGELIEKKPMKRITRYYESCIVSTKFMDLDE